MLLPPLALRRKEEEKGETITRLTYSLSALLNLKSRQAETVSFYVPPLHFPSQIPDESAASGGTTDTAASVASAASPAATY